MLYADVSFSSLKMTLSASLSDNGGTGERGNWVGPKNCIVGKCDEQVLFAYCDVAPPEGGQTPLLLSNIVYRKMCERDPAFVKRLQDEGLCYVRVAPEEHDVDSALGRSWKSTFFADDRKTGEENAKNAGFDVEWLPDGSMKYTTAPLAAIRTDPRTGRWMLNRRCVRQPHSERSERIYF
jgi:hypothetical protein